MSGGDPHMDWLKFLIAVLVVLAILFLLGVHIHAG